MQEKHNDLAGDVAAVQSLRAVNGILEDVCSISGMGFACVSRVTDSHWIACQVNDRLGFGIDAGDELDVKTTICYEICLSGRGVFIDHATDDPYWKTHHAPALFGFESYISVPITLDDGSIFGTLCAVDPDPRDPSLSNAYAVFESYAQQIGGLLSALRKAPSAG